MDFLRILFFCLMASSGIAQMKYYPKSLPSPDSLRTFPMLIGHRTPEDGLAAGLGIFYRFHPIPYTDSTKRRFSTLFLSLSHTTHQQTILELNHHIFFLKGKIFLRGNQSIEDYYDKYFGIGSNTQVQYFEQYRFQRSVWYQQALYQYHKNNYMGLIGWYYQLHNIHVLQGNGGLVNGTTPGFNGSTTKALGFNLLHDSRDHQFVSKKGFFYDIQAFTAPSVFGSTHPFQRFRSDIRWYYSFHPQRTWAFQWLTDACTPGTPFNMMPILGGDRMMRGFYRGRFRDTHMTAIQAEYRWMSTYKIGFEAFGSTGQVSQSWHKWNDSPWKFAGGVGLRMSISEKNRTVLRIDYARNSEGGNAWYLKINEAF